VALRNFNEKISILTQKHKKEKLGGYTCWWIKKTRPTFRINLVSWLRWWRGGWGTRIP